MTKKHIFKSVLKNGKKIILILFVIFVLFKNNWTLEWWMGATEFFKSSQYFLMPNLDITMDFVQQHPLCPNI